MEVGNRIEISPETLQAWLEVGEPVEVIDIRPRTDYEAWRIPGSRSVDAYQAISANRPGPLADYKPPAGVSAVMVCFVGRTSLKAAEYLRSRGLQAFSLVGGMEGWSLAWNTAPVPVEDTQVRVIQVRRTGKGCLSYMVGSEGEALVIDPSLDAQIYLDLAVEYGWRIVKVVDTHIHADHLSRARALVGLARCEHYLPAQQRARFGFLPIRDGDILRIGAARLVAMSTPGHTPESMILSLAGHTLFTGDTLFLEGIGRPDLNTNRSEAGVRAQVLYRSLQGLRALDPEALVLPGHTSRPVPFDRAALAGQLHDVLRRLDAIRLDETAFVDWVLKKIPPTPTNFQLIVAHNEQGRLPGGNLAQLEAGANRCAI